MKRRQDQERELEEQIAAGEKTPEARADLPLPKIPYVSDDRLGQHADPPSTPRSDVVPMPTNHDTSRFPGRCVTSNVHIYICTDTYTPLDLDRLNIIAIDVSRSVPPSRFPVLSGRVRRSTTT